MMARSAPTLCSSCGGRLARDNTGTVCSPCRRTDIETVAHQGAIDRGDVSAIKTAFDSSGLNGVAEQLNCSPQDALDVLLNTQLLPFVSTQRRLLLRQLVALNDVPHVAAARALNISRWTVAALRGQLGIELRTERPTSMS